MLQNTAAFENSGTLLLKVSLVYIVICLCHFIVFGAELSDVVQCLVLKNCHIYLPTLQLRKVLPKALHRFSLILQVQVDTQRQNTQQTMGLQSASSLLVSDVLVLLLVNDKSGKFYGDDMLLFNDTQIRASMRAALLMDLVMLHRIQISKQDNLVHCVDLNVTGHQLLDQMLLSLFASDVKKSMQDWIQDFMHGTHKIETLRNSVLESCVQRGILSHLPPNIYHVAKPELKQEWINKIRYCCTTPVQQLKIYKSPEYNDTKKMMAPSDFPFFTETTTLPRVVSQDYIPSAPHYVPTEEDGFEIVDAEQVIHEQPVQYLMSDEYARICVLVPLVHWISKSLFDSWFTAQEVPSAHKFVQSNCFVQHVSPNAYSTSDSMAMLAAIETIANIFAIFAVK